MRQHKARAQAESTPKPSRKRILVTGGAGFIGSHLVDALIAQNNHVTILDDFSSGKRENVSRHAQNPNVRILRGTILDFAQLKKAMSGMDVVFHLAVKCIRLSIAKPLENHDVNATGSLYVCEAARQSRVGRLVYVSSSEVYGTALGRRMSESDPCLPTTVYGGAKLAGEAYTRAYHETYGLNTIIVRPFNTYGPREHYEGPLGEVIPKFMIRIANGLPPIIQGDGLQTRDFTYVSDTVEGILRASQCAALTGQQVNIAAGREQSIKKIAGLVAEVMGSPIQPTHQPARPGDVRRHQADISLALKLLDFRPTISIKAGIRMYYEWLKSHCDLRALGRENQEKNWVIQ